MRAFRARYPAIEVTLRELPPAEQLEALKAGHLDVGFVRGPLDDPALVSQCVRREPLVVALPADHVLASRKRIPLELLASESFVIFPRQRSPSFFDQIMGLCRRAGFTPHIVQEAPQLDVISLVAAGFGVAIVPWSIREFRREGLTLRPIIGSPRTDLLVTWRAGKVPPVLREFLELLHHTGFGERQKVLPSGPIERKVEPRR